MNLTDVPSEAFEIAYNKLLECGVSDADGVAAAVLPAVGDVLIHAGREAAAVDIEEYRGPDPSSASAVWWAGYSEAKRDAARIARDAA